MEIQKEKVMKYDFAAIEKKWQDKWEKTKPYAAVTGDHEPEVLRAHRVPVPLRPAGLHVGHPRPFTAMDIVTPQKADAGLQRPRSPSALTPSACRRRTSPSRTTSIPPSSRKQNIENFTRQLKMLGYGFDWDRVRGHHRPQLLQVDPVDLPADVQAWPGLQDHHARQLVHQLQVRAGQRGGRRGRVRALRQRGHPQGKEPVDAAHHRSTPTA